MIFNFTFTINRYYYNRFNEVITWTKILIMNLKLAAEKCQINKEFYISDLLTMDQCPGIFIQVAEAPFKIGRDAPDNCAAHRWLCNYLQLKII